MFVNQHYFNCTNALLFFEKNYHTYTLACEVRNVSSKIFLFFH